MSARALLNRDFVLLWQGQLVSQLGNQAFALAMVYWLMEATGSASLMGLLMMVSLLPGVVLGPLGGAVADRHSRLRIIIVSDLVRGLMILAVAALMYLRADDIGLIVAALFAVGLLNGLVNAVFQPAITATVPDLVPERNLTTANSLIQFTVQVAVMTGQAVGGLLYRMVGAAALFAINAAAYLVSSFTEAFIRLPKERVATGIEAKVTIADYAHDTLDGIRYVWSRTGMRTFLLVAAGVNFLAMPVIILLPFYVTEQLGRDAAWYGYLLAALGGGALFGYLQTGAVRVPARLRPLVVITALLAVAVLFATLGAVHNPPVALALMFAVGVCTGSINIFVITLFQATTPGEMRGRVMSLVIAMSGAATPLGMALGGVLGDVTGKNIPLLYLVCGGSIALLTLGATRQARFRRFLEWETPAR